jgi:hypothetical protein
MNLCALVTNYTAFQQVLEGHHHAVAACSKGYLKMLLVRDGPVVKEL